jgi:hypothetical protein
MGVIDPLLPVALYGSGPSRTSLNGPGADIDDDKT